MSTPTSTSAFVDCERAIANLADQFATAGIARGERQHLDRADFSALAEAGFLRTALPESRGGFWRGLSSSIRPYATLLRRLARGDPTVALVAAMHPIVVGHWLGVETTDAFDPDELPLWREQVEFVWSSIAAGHWWGTLTSEPGSGGDIRATHTVATQAPNEPLPLRFLLTGEKHFGSGSGIASFMTTTARVGAETEPRAMFFDLRHAPWDGSTGLRLLRAWDGHGMRASQSHAFTLRDFPATAYAGARALPLVRGVVSQLGVGLFCAVAMGVIDNVLGWARPRLLVDGARAFATAEVIHAENEAWLAEQAFEGLLRAIEAGDASAGLTALQAKWTIGALAESLCARLARAIGGSAFSRQSPLGQWADDLRALGFLRPPWALAFDQLHGALVERERRRLPALAIEAKDGS